MGPFSARVKALVGLATPCAEWRRKRTGNFRSGGFVISVAASEHDLVTPHPPRRAAYRGFGSSLRRVNLVPLPHNTKVFPNLWVSSPLGLLPPAVGQGLQPQARPDPCRASRHRRWPPSTGRPSRPVRSAASARDGNARLRRCPSAPGPASPRIRSRPPRASSRGGSEDTQGAGCGPARPEPVASRRGPAGVPTQPRWPGRPSPAKGDLPPRRGSAFPP